MDKCAKEQKEIMEMLGPIFDCSDFGYDKSILDLPREEELGKAKTVFEYYDLIADNLVKKRGGRGVCLDYACYLAKKLKEKGIQNSIVFTASESVIKNGKEEKVCHAVNAYVREGQLFICDPTIMVDFKSITKRFSRHLKLMDKLQKNIAASLECKCAKLVNPFTGEEVLFEEKHDHFVEFVVAYIYVCRCFDIVFENKALELTDEEIDANPELKLAIGILNDDETIKKIFAGVLKKGKEKLLNKPINIIIKLLTDCREQLDKCKKYFNGKYEKIEQPQSVWFDQTYGEYDKNFYDKRALFLDAKDYYKAGEVVDCAYMIFGNTGDQMNKWAHSAGEYKKTIFTEICLYEKKLLNVEFIFGFVGTERHCARYKEIIGFTMRRGGKLITEYLQEKISNLLKPVFNIPEAEVTDQIDREKELNANDILDYYNRIAENLVTKNKGKGHLLDYVCYLAQKLSKEGVQNAIVFWHDKKNNYLHILNAYVNAGELFICDLESYYMVAKREDKVGSKFVFLGEEFKYMSDKDTVFFVDTKKYDVLVFGQHYGGLCEWAEQIEEFKSSMREYMEFIRENKQEELLVKKFIELTGGIDFEDKNGALKKYKRIIHNSIFRDGINISAEKTNGSDDEIPKMGTDKARDNEIG